MAYCFDQFLKCLLTFGVFVVCCVVVVVVVTTGITVVLSVCCVVVLTTGVTVEPPLWVLEGLVCVLSCENVKEFEVRTRVKP